MPFNSACPKHWFKSVILGTYTRIIDSNNTYSGLMTDIDRFKAILMANSYPETYIEKFNSELRKKISSSTTFGYKEQTEPIPTVPHKQVNIKVPFFHALIFDELIRMKSKLRKLIPSLNLHIIVKSFLYRHLSRLDP